MKKTVILFISLLALLLTTPTFVQGQAIGVEATINNAGTPLKSGFYEAKDIGVEVGRVPDISHSWMHLINSRHSNPANSYQLQIGASFTENNKLYFRKIAVDPSNIKNTQWHEIATRGSNTFWGEQGVINGNTSYSSSNMFSGSSILHLGQNQNNVNVGVALLRLTSFNGDGAIGVTYNGTHNADMVFGVNNGYYDPSNPALANVIERMRIKANGNVGIGTPNPGNYKLAVEGKIGAREVQVLNATPWPDYVFEPTYSLRSLVELERFLQQNKHLPEVPSAAEVAKEGIELGKMNALLLKKIEELTLYVIEQNKKLEALSAENARQNQQLEKLRTNHKY